MITGATVRLWVSAEQGAPCLAELGQSPAEVVLQEDGVDVLSAPSRTGRQGVWMPDLPVEQGAPKGLGWPHLFLHQQ